jgi:RHS repeat-associated protein
VSYHLIDLPDANEQPLGRAYEVSNLAGGPMYQRLEVWDVQGYPTAPDGWQQSYSYFGYDGRGNQIYTRVNNRGWEFAQDYSTAEEDSWERTYATSYYASDGKLMVQQTMRDLILFPNDTIDAWGAYEEYWYDAFGRRVLKRSQQEEPVCEHEERCYSAIERYIWDGSQILWEFRQADAGDVRDPAGGAQTGHVGYVHAGGIDAPLAMIRNDTALVLHHDFRGLYHAATNTAGGSYGADVPWPSDAWTLSFAAVEPREVHTWIGSLPMGQQDHTGLAYRRNRYINSISGQFTQADPIGFSGGFNLYGYGGGDPINNSDPFGLAPCPPPEFPDIICMDEFVGSVPRGPGPLPEWWPQGTTAGGGAFSDYLANQTNPGLAQNFNVPRQESPQDARCSADMDQAFVSLLVWRSAVGAISALPGLSKGQAVGPASFMAGSAVEPIELAHYLTDTSGTPNPLIPYSHNWFGYGFGVLYEMGKIGTSPIFEGGEMLVACSTAFWTR